MFLTGWDGWVWALDAKTGTEIWRYKHAVPFDVSLCCGNVNRGVAVAKGKVFFVTANAHRARARRHHRQAGLGPGPTETCGPGRAPRSRRWS